MRTGVRLGLLALVAVVLGGVYFFLSRDTEPTTTGFLYTFPSGDRLEEMRIVNQKGSCSRSAREDGKWDHHRTWQLPGQPAESPASWRISCWRCRSIASCTGAAPEYGLDNPQATIEMTTTSGIRKALLVGNLTASKAQVYLKDKDSGKVFVSDLGSVTQFDGSLDAYRDKDIFSVDKNNIVEFSYFVDGEKQVTAQRTNGQDWQLTYPYESPAREIEINEFLIGLRKWSAIMYPAREQAGLQGAGTGPPPGRRWRSWTQRARSSASNSGRKRKVSGSSARAARRTSPGSSRSMSISRNLDAADLVFFQPLQTTIDRVASIELTEGG